MQINFISHKDSEETRTMYTKSRNIEITEGNDIDEIIEELFESLTKLSKKFTRTNEREQVLIPDSIDSLYYHLLKVDLKRGGS